MLYCSQVQKSARLLERAVEDIAGARLVVVPAAGGAGACGVLHRTGLCIALQGSSLMPRGNSHVRLGLRPDFESASYVQRQLQALFHGLVLHPCL